MRDAGDHRPATAESRAARLSAAAFAWLGGALVLAGVAAILAGQPQAPRGAPAVAGLADLVRRLPELSLPISAAVAGIVAIALGAMLARRSLGLGLAATELAVLGLAIEFAAIAGASHFAYAADGAILPGAVAVMSGGIAVLVSALTSGLAGATLTSADVVPSRRSS